ncbi:vps51/Vps67 domain-containing protein [Hirsutella rhossiliensis]|uniref:Conserved oligomeric Golgi complex subunit 1 n=1 Tax=Hirsutella rhossiliensis TaxID=111463 RepID=A0A9P8SF77_9HYPO|nr:vps51/Vps67 domain-containing protein [Hirsutella rhossiliensis]KAH0959150.1 vps51/Vps67 domain-containing protein [Hirsutella rhossiliensis]
MASVPDPSTFTSSAQIFSAKHTLPQIRSMHNALSVQIEEKASRLRSQVGGSYRELLGTADTIVQMRGDNDRVQELLGNMGGRCGRSVVSAKAKGLAEFVLLDACGLMVGRILKGQGGVDDGVKRGQRLVLATKVWVLGRLLIKSLGEETSDESVKRRLETARRAMATMRRRLLSCVRKILDKADDGTERDDVLKALCAYSLVTSSGARDVLRYFLSAREEAMALAFIRDEGMPSPTTEDVIHSLSLYTGTILEVQFLVPGKLSPALGNLKSHPLLDDSSLRGLEGLHLDVSATWCSEEIRYFMPFVRHDDLDGKLARDKLAEWADKGGQIILEGLKKTLERMTELKSILDLRTRVLQLWIREGGRAKGFDPLEMQDDLRDAINSRMLAVLETKVTKLRLVGSEVKATLEAWQQGVTDQVPGLWDEDGYDAALSKGAAPFVQEVVSRLYGRSDPVSKAVHSYSSWVHVIDDVRDAVEQLRRQRWDNDYDEIEDEETIEARQQVLSNDDPRKLQEKLDAALDTAFQELEEQLGKLWRESSEGPANGPIAMYMIRILRDVRAQLPERPAIKDFGLALVPSLHSSVVAHVSATALDDFAATFLSDRELTGRLLWEGEPPLPNQPSPGIFRFLQTLSLAMADAGIDLWSAEAVTALKRHTCGRLRDVWQRELSGLSSSKMADTGKDDGMTSEDQECSQKDGDTEHKSEAQEDGKGDTEAEAREQGAVLSASQVRDIAVQWHFDVSFLLCCVGNISGSASEDLRSIESNMVEQSGLEDGPSRQRVVRASQDYWQRTSLLFGLLA